jgi:hypothetical protein
MTGKELNKQKHFAPAHGLDMSSPYDSPLFTLYCFPSYSSTQRLINSQTYLLIGSFAYRLIDSKTFLLLYPKLTTIFTVVPNPTILGIRSIDLHGDLQKDIQNRD